MYLFILPHVKSKHMTHWSIYKLNSKNRIKYHYLGKKEEVKQVDKMASSHSIGKGQTALVCQLCENDPNIKWKCLDCELLMCQRCRDKVHPKFPLAQDHIIIDIKDIHQHQSEPKLEFTQLKCGVHTGQKSCLYCNTCMNLYVLCV